MSKIVSTLTLATDDGARIIKRLSNHWRHKMDISENDGKTIIPFSVDDTAVLSATDNELVATLTTKEQEPHDKLQSVVLNHINRMAGQEFDVVWQQN